MTRWPWCFERTYARRDLIGATLLIALFALLHAVRLATSDTCVLDPTVRARDEAASVASTIGDLARTRGGCIDALSRLPLVRSAVTLRKDPWGNAWSIRCHRDLAIVRSAGADGVFGAEDDIVEVVVTPAPKDH